MATINGTVGNDTRIGTGAADQIFGLEGNDSLSGAGGNDVLDGGAGNDTLDGGAGVDTASYEVAVGAVTVSLAVSVAQETGGADLDILTNFENLRGSAFGDTLMGNGGNNLIDGGAGSDLLDGGAGYDTQLGRLGDNVYAIDAVLPAFSLLMSGEPGDYISQGLGHLYTSDTGTFAVSNVRDYNNDGLIDWVSLRYTDAAHFWYFDFSTDDLGQNLAPGDYADAQRAAFADPGHAGLDVSGDGRGSNQVFGSFTIHEVSIDYSGASPVLTRFAANFEQHSENATAPALYGTINYNNPDAGEPAFELQNQGVDTILSSVTVKAPRNIENVTLTGNASINAIGNEAANVLTGNASHNALTGLAGNDTLDGSAGADTAVYSGARANYVIPGAAAGTVTGPEGTDTVTGIERYQFSDVNLAFDLALGQAAGNTVRLIGAAFGAATIGEHPDYVGIGLDLFDNGTSMAEVCAAAAGILALGDAAFVDRVFANVVGRAPTAAEQSEYVGLLAGSGGPYTQAQVLELAVAVPLNEININLVGLQQNGVEFV